MTPPQPLQWFVGFSHLADLPAAQRGEAGVARRAPVVEALDVDEPAVLAGGRGRRLALRGQPAQVGALEHARPVRDPAVGVADRGADHPLRGEEGHLRVVGNRPADAAVGRQVAGHAGGAQPRVDLLERPELDRRPERVADRARQQAAADAGAGVRRAVYCVPWARGFVDHLRLSVRDVPASRAFYPREYDREPDRYAVFFSTRTGSSSRSSTRCRAVHQRARARGTARRWRARRG